MKNVKKNSSNNIIPFKLLIGLLRTVATNGTTFTVARIYHKIHKINDSFVLFFGANQLKMYTRKCLYFCSWPKTSCSVRNHARCYPAQNRKYTSNYNSIGMIFNPIFEKLHKFAYMFSDESTKTYQPFVV